MEFVSRHKFRLSALGAVSAFPHWSLLLALPWFYSYLYFWWFYYKYIRALWFSLFWEEIITLCYDYQRIRIVLEQIYISLQKFKIVKVYPHISMRFWCLWRIRSCSFWIYSRNLDDVIFMVSLHVCSKVSLKIYISSWRIEHGKFHTMRDLDVADKHPFTFLGWYPVTEPQPIFWRAGKLSVGICTKEIKTVCWTFNCFCYWTCQCFLKKCLQYFGRLKFYCWLPNSLYTVEFNYDLCFL